MDSNTENLVYTFANQLIENVSEFKELQLALAELNDTTVSKNLFDEVNTRKDTISLLQTKGLPVSQDQTDELAILMAEMRDDELIMKYLRCKNLARKKAIELCNQLESITGVDFSSKRGCC